MHPSLSHSMFQGKGEKSSLHHHITSSASEPRKKKKQFDFAHLAKSVLDDDATPASSQVLNDVVMTDPRDTRNHNSAMAAQELQKRKQMSQMLAAASPYLTHVPSTFPFNQR